MDSCFSGQWCHRYKKMALPSEKVSIFGSSDSEQVSYAGPNGSYYIDAIYWDICATEPDDCLNWLKPNIV